MPALFIYVESSTYGQSRRLLAEPDALLCAHHRWCADAHSPHHLVRVRGYRSGSSGGRSAVRTQRAGAASTCYARSPRSSRANARTLRSRPCSSQSFDEIAARIGKAIENSPAKDIEKNVKAMLASGLARLDLVPRAEFDVQSEVLRKTREKLEALEKRVAEFEARFPPPA